MVTPGFLADGIDFAKLVMYYLANGCYIEITNPAEVALIRNLIKHVIDTSYGYDGDISDFAKTIHGRLQMIFNSAIEELFLQKAGFYKRSSAIWRLCDSYERGTDFQSMNGKQIEAKVYKNFDSMSKYAKKGSKDYTVFHGAEYVLCYLINSFKPLDSEESKHWFWLKKINGVYDVYDDIELNNITDECLPKTIPICYCKMTDNKFIINKSNFFT